MFVPTGPPCGGEAARTETLPRFTGLKPAFLTHANVVEAEVLTTAGTSTMVSARVEPDVNPTSTRDPWTSPVGFCHAPYPILVVTAVVMPCEQALRSFASLRCDPRGRNE